jgi:hypothetical protein
MKVRIIKMKKFNNKKNHNWQIIILQAASIFQVRIIWKRSKKVFSESVNLIVKENKYQSKVLKIYKFAKMLGAT